MVFQKTVDLFILLTIQMVNHTILVTLIFAMVWRSVDPTPMSQHYFIPTSWDALEKVALQRILARHVHPNLGCVQQNN